MSEFVLIKAEDLEPHPDNPRKNLGDLTELTESIRKNGILQNLTVVKHGDKYRVVIGHRRLAAAKKAGLKEIPCTVAILDTRQQLCTMMEENMQRQDLTIPEQAYGFQYMLKLGETIESIARKTGFSETTVRHRLEIAKLSKSTLKSATENKEWQMTVKDYIELEKIKDIKTRERIIKENSNTGRWRFQQDVFRAIEDEKIDENRKKWLPLLEAAGIEQDEKAQSVFDGNYRQIREIDLRKDKAPKKLILKDYDKKTPLTWKEQYRSIFILQKRTKTKALTKGEIERQEREKEEKEFKKKQKNLIKEMQLCALAVFEGNIDEPDASEEMDTIFALWNVIKKINKYMNIMTAAYTVLGSKKVWNLEEAEKKEIRERMNTKRISTQLLVAMMGSLEDMNFIYYDKSYRADEGKQGMMAYETLHNTYGFCFTDPEYMQILDGTHEFYKKEKGDK